MFNQQPNNNYNQVNVNTTFATSAGDKYMMLIIGWNEKLTIKFRPMIGTSQTGLRQYSKDKNMEVTVTLTQPNIYALEEGIRNELLPAIKDRRATNIAVSTNTNMQNGDKVKIFTIAYDGDDHVYVNVNTSTSDNSPATSGTEVSHMLNNKSWLTNYQPSTGSSEVSTVCYSDLATLYHALERAKDFRHYDEHCSKYSKAVAGSFQNQNNGNYNQNGQNNYQGQNNNQSQNYSAPTATYSGTDMSDFIY